MNARIDLRPGYSISRVIRGGWQLAGGHGPVDAERAIEDLTRAYDAGITTFDCADIYTGVEELFGRFRAYCRAARGAAALRELRVHTKFVPDLERLARIDRAYVRTIVERSLRRLGMERLDLVQFHWWDYGTEGMLETASWLDELRREGLIAHIGGTNFDAPRTQALVDAGIPLIAMQVQYSLLDDRPAHALSAVCRRSNIALLAYGSVAGGLLSERWLGADEPRAPFAHRSLTKYMLIVDEFGGWELFQTLLRTLAGIARRHECDIASIASAWVLAQPQAGAVIVGARSDAHTHANANLTAIELTPADCAEIAAVTAQRRGPLGDCFELERDRNGAHGRIMKYNLNVR